MKAILSPFGPGDSAVQLTRDFSDLDWTVVTSPEEAARAVPGTAIYVTSNRTCYPATGEALRRHGGALRWMHFTSAGIDGGLRMGIPDGVIVTNSTGVRSGNVSEHALLLLLALTRALPTFAATQRTRQWPRGETAKKVRTLEGAVVCIVGRGSIGRELARKLKALNARPIAVSRTIEMDDTAEQVFPRERLGEALALADAVAVCTSDDDDTRHLIGAAELAAMKAGAFLVNIARGSIVDEAALIGALRSGHLGGAGLDVAEIEPMPEDNPLWDMPNVIISPHISGAGSSSYPQQHKLFGENLARFRAGMPLLNDCQIGAAATGGSR